MEYLSIMINEFSDKIKEDIQNSNLHIAVIRLILQDILNDINQLYSQQLKKEYDKIKEYEQGETSNES